MHAMRRWVVPVGLLMAGLVSTAGVGRAQTAQQESLQERRQLTDEQQAEALKLGQLLDAALAGEPVPSDVSVEWRHDFLKAQNGQTYVPFTLSIDPDTLGSRSISFFVRLVLREESPAPSSEALDDDGLGRGPEQRRGGRRSAPEPERPSYAFEDVFFADLRPSLGGDPLRVSRALSVLGGEYDAYIAIKDSELVESESVEIRQTVFRYRLVVPDLWTDELATSSIFMTDQVERISVPLTPEQQRADPYAIGGARIMPRTDLDYTTTDACSFIFFIYNPVLSNNKPNVTVEYTFHQRTDDGEEEFNSTTPQTLNAETLPPQFDMILGHQLSAGQHVPLASFPAGAYRLEITVTDNESGSSLTRDVSFTVTES